MPFLANAKLLVKVELLNVAFVKLTEFLEKVKSKRLSRFSIFFFLNILILAQKVAVFAQVPQAAVLL